MALRPVPLPQLFGMPLCPLLSWDPSLPTWLCRAPSGHPPPPRTTQLAGPHLLLTQTAHGTCPFPPAPLNTPTRIFTGR